MALSNRFGVAWDDSVVEYLGIPPLVRPADDADAQRAWDLGAAMTLEDAVAYAVEITAELSGREPAG